MQEFDLETYRANAKLLSFFEYLYIKLGLKEEEAFLKEYFEIINENDLIESLNYYIVENHVTAQITADKYIKINDYKLPLNDDMVKLFSLYLPIRDFILQIYSENCELLFVTAEGQSCLRPTKGGKGQINYDSFSESSNRSGSLALADERMLCPS